MQKFCIGRLFLHSALCLLPWFCGCASKPPATAQAFPTLPGMTNGGLVSAPAIVLPPPPALPVDLPPFIYPPDASNHAWNVQESPDLVTWTNYAGPFYGQPGGEFVISNAASPSFWRMEADQ